MFYTFFQTENAFRWLGCTTVNVFHMGYIINKKVENHCVTVDLQYTNVCNSSTSPPGYEVIAIANQHVKIHIILKKERNIHKNNRWNGSGCQLLNIKDFHQDHKKITQ